MVRWLWSGTLIVLVLLLAACQPIQPREQVAESTAAAMPEEASMDPEAVMAAYTAAINAHDVEAALALVAEDAVYARPAGEFNGREEIRGFIEGLVARNVQVELVGERVVDGEQVTWTSRVRLADPQNPSGPAVEIVNQSESLVRDGKIIFHQARPAQ